MGRLGQDMASNQLEAHLATAIQSQGRICNAGLANMNNL